MTGITENTVADIFQYIKRHEERAFVLKFSATEIYNEAVRDLLSKDSSPLRLLDDPEEGTIVEKLTEETLRDWNHLKQLLSVCEGIISWYKIKRRLSHKSKFAHPGNRNPQAKFLHTTGRSSRFSARRAPSKHQVVSGNCDLLTLPETNRLAILQKPSSNLWTL
ncbi:hypothetical protein IFM89_012508 [Coptis chinensis]|uniref:Kinesin motor domain-containing protein n=1 Tax=Coptis chinensis TaxID=261450 RepID=A0A835LUV3_9MAGN|nr:hypothetical protein IFM89_012508 [Coptis chinensis]